jgi:sialate O-acetylesterase
MKNCLMLLALMVGMHCYADVRLPKLVGDNMVLQRNTQVRIWGWCDANETVTVQFMDKEYKALVRDTMWQIILPSMDAGGPYTMKIKANNDITLKNILIGDVWLCSGQSNMGFLMMNTSNAKEEIPKANYDNIRLFTIKKDYSNNPLTEAEDVIKWESCTSSTITKFSAVAYFFGRKLHEDLKVPIGLVWSAYGGTTIESWISTEGLADEETFGEKAASIYKYDLKEEERVANEKFDAWINYINKADAGTMNGMYPWTSSYHTDWKDAVMPATWDNTDGLKNKDGVIWFQKEVQLTAKDLDKDATISLGAIGDEDFTFINGKQVGHRYDDRNYKRNYTIPKAFLKEGGNVITVRITNYRDDGGFLGKNTEFSLKTSTNNISLNGDWKYKIGLDTIVPTGLARQINTRQIPCILYNAMIAPTTNYTFKGVLWYQGESNAPRGFQYRYLFARLINDWRKKFGNSKLPFVYVQLPNYKKILSKPADAEWAETRESQAVVLKLPNTSMACAIDQGDAGNIHPKYKNEVGKRLALQAEYNVYGIKDMLPSGPVYKSMKIDGDKILIEFDITGSGLQTIDGSRTVKGFAIAGDDKQFVWADAEIVNSTTVAVSAASIKKPVAVRYAWADNPGVLNLSNATNMPAYPFRTDTWKGKTDDVKIMDYTKGAVQ